MNAREPFEFTTPPKASRREAAFVLVGLALGAWVIVIGVVIGLVYGVLYLMGLVR